MSLHRYPVINKPGTLKMPRNNSLIIVFLYYYWKIIGLCPFKVTSGHLEISILEIILALMRCSGLLYASTYLAYLDHSIDRFGLMTILAGVTGISLDIVSTIFVWIFSATRVRKIESVLKKFVILHNRLQGVGLRKDRERDFLDKLALHCLFVNSFFWIHIIILVAIFLMAGKFNFPTLIYQSSRVILWNTVILFIYGVSFIRGKFQSINDSIKNVHFYSEVKGDWRDVRVAQQVFFTTRLEGLKNTGPYLESMGQIHEDLKDLLHTIENIFAVPILLAIVVNFTECSSCLYTLARTFRTGIPEWNVKEVATMTTFSTWALANLIQMLLIVSIPSLTDEEANRTGNALHYMWITYRPRNTRFVVEAVSMRLLQRKTIISLYGLIRLNFPLIYRLANIVAGSIVILTQLEGHDQKFQAQEQLKLEQLPGLPFGYSMDDHNTSEYYIYSSTANPHSQFFELSGDVH